MSECTRALGIISWGPASVQEGGKAGQNQQLEKLLWVHKYESIINQTKINPRKRQGAMEEPLRLPNGDLTRTPGETLGVLLESHFPGARINRGPEMSLNITSGANSADWYMARNMVMEDRLRWAVNSFMPYEASGPDGICPICMSTKGIWPNNQVPNWGIQRLKSNGPYTKTMERC